MGGGRARAGAGRAREAVATGYGEGTGGQMDARAALERRAGAPAATAAKRLFSVKKHESRLRKDCSCMMKTCDIVGCERMNESFQMV